MKEIRVAPSLLSADFADLRAAIEAELGHPVVVPRYPQLVVALGAALVAQELVTGVG